MSFFIFYYFYGVGVGRDLSLDQTDLNPDPIRIMFIYPVGSG